MRACRRWSSTAWVLGLLAAFAPAGSAGAQRDDSSWLVVRGAESAPDPGLLRLAELPPDRAALLSQNELGYAELLWRSDLHISRDGTLTERVTLIRHFFNRTGLELGGDVAFLAQPSRERVILEQARVVHRNGQSFDVESETVQATNADQPRVFSDVRLVTVPLPGLEVGATGIIVYTHRLQASKWPLPWSRHYQLQTGSPVERLEVNVEWDSGVATPAWATRDPSLDCASQGRRLRCTKTQVDALRPDADLRAARDTTPELVVAEAQTWGQLVERVRNMVEEKVDEGLPREALESLLDKGRTRAETWDALYRFVADDVRYLGLERGTDAVVPSAPAITFGRRFGDCKDKVTLFVALARAAGLEVTPVLVGTEHFDADALLLPSIGYFNHMIACVADLEGAQECADLTLTKATPAESVLALGGNVALPLGAQDGEATTLARERFGWMVEVAGETELRCDGSMRKHVERRIGGMAKLSFQKTFAGVSPADRRRFLLDEHRRATSSSIPADVRVVPAASPEDPISIVSDLETPPSKPLAEGDERVDDDSWVRAYGLLLRSDNQHYRTSVPGLSLHSTQRYAFCDGFGPRLIGPALAFESNLGSLTRDYQRGRAEVVVDTTLKIPGGLLAPAEVRRLNRFLDGALDQVGIWFSVGRSPGS